MSPERRLFVLTGLLGGFTTFSTFGHDTARLLAGVEHAAHGLRLPEGACGSWTALYTGLRKFSEDLVTHMHLENNVLFARFEPAHA